jgi:hypothetical protein
MESRADTACCGERAVTSTRVAVGELSVIRVKPRIRITKPGGNNSGSGVISN